MEKLLKAKEVAELTELGVSTIHHLVGSGKIPFVKINRALRFELREIEKWIEERRAKKGEKK